MAKKKLLFINCTLGLGGVERSLCDVLRHVDYNKYDVDLYLDSVLGGLTDQLPDKVNIVKPNMDGTYGRLLSITPQLLKARDYKRLIFRIIKSLSNRYEWIGKCVFPLLFNKYGVYDTVIAYREGDITKFGYYTFKWKRFVGWWHYGDVPDKNEEYLKLDKMQALVAVSKANKEMLEGTFPYLKEKIKVIPNMVDTLRLRYAASECLTDFSTDRVHIVTVARLSPEKHLENVIYCAEKLKKAGLKVQWHIIGGGLQYEELKDRIGRSSATETITLEGEKSNPYPYVKNADLYVHPSYVESQGLTILEAMALGVPCVVTKSLGPCEFIEDGVNGLLTEQSAEDLAEKVLEILQNRELYERIRNNTRCPEQFLPERVMEKIEELLEE